MNRAWFVRQRRHGTSKINGRREGLRSSVFRRGLFLLLVLSSLGCGDDGGNNDSDGSVPDATIVDGRVVVPDAQLPNELGTELSLTATRWDVPAVGIKTQGVTSLGRQSGFENIIDEYWVTRDMNGDGRLDLVVTTVIRDVQGEEDLDDTYDEPWGFPDNSHWRVYFGQAEGFSSDYQQWALPPGGKSDRGFNYAETQAADRLNNTHGRFNKESDEAWVLRDMDGDGRPDLVVTGVATEVVMLGYVFQVFGGANPYWKVYKNTGTGFEQNATQWLLPRAVRGHAGDGLSLAASAATAEGYENLWDLVDMDGDGRVDFVVYADVEHLTQFETRVRPQGHPAGPRWRVFLNEGSRFAEVQTDWFLPAQRGDEINGLNALSGQGTQEGDHRWSLFDIDGDRAPELIVTAQNIAGQFKAPGHPSDPHWELYDNNGAGFDAFAKFTLPQGGTGAGGFNALVGAGSNVAGDDSWATTDINGDKKADLIIVAEFVTGASGGHFALGRRANEPHWRVHLYGEDGFETANTRWNLPMGGLREFGFNSLGGAGTEVGDHYWAFTDISGDGQPDLVLTATAVSRPDANAFTMPLIQGHGDDPFWNVYLNQP